ncbi:MAG: MBL fold metallo-hydrolase [SAR202 cluster bacterium]|nr:MBL fold metallo-hydrolase [SAR202 cluster bacterium]
MPNSTVRVGNVEITSFSDGYLEFDACNFFPQVTDAQWHPHEEHLTGEGKVRFNLASYVVRTAGRTVLVDTGLGPPTADDAPNSPWGELLASLAARGVRPQDVDMVVMTHLHRDHVGWNLQKQGSGFSPTFPKARYWMSRKDWEASHRIEVRQRFPNAPSCVWPLESLGLMELMDGEHALTPELTAVPTPGHTPGHMSILVTSQGQKALILGDAAHSPAQVQETDWVSRADMDSNQARDTRRALMERLEREGILVAAGHFPAPGFGKILLLNGRRYWQGLAA